MASLDDAFLPAGQTDCEIWVKQNAKQARRTRKCDFCGGRLGLIIHRYYRMRFCCEAHMSGYHQRLTEETRAKIRLLESRNTGAALARSEEAFTISGRR
jgi:hypothetical protein